MSFVISEGLQGVVCNANALLAPEGPPAVAAATEAGVTVAAWGGLCNSEVHQRKLEKMGVQVMIADNVRGLSNLTS